MSSQRLKDLGNSSGSSTHDAEEKMMRMRRRQERRRKGRFKLTTRKTMLLCVQMSNLAKNGNLGSQSESGPSGGNPDRVRKPTTVRRSRKV